MAAANRGVPSEAIIAERPVVEGLIKLAEERCADLLAVGTSGESASSARSWAPRATRWCTGRPSLSWSSRRSRVASTRPSPAAEHAEARPGTMRA